MGKESRISKDPVPLPSSKYGVLDIRQLDFPFLTDAVQPNPSHTNSEVRAIELSCFTGSMHRMATFLYVPISFPKSREITRKSLHSN